LNWSNKTVYPAVLAKSYQDPSKRNIDLYGIEINNNSFGEERFLATEYADFGVIYDDNVLVEMVDFTKHKIDIDLYHIPRGSPPEELHKFAKKYFRTDTTYIYSNISPYHYMEVRDKNVCMFLPASYDNHFKDRNTSYVYPHWFEAVLLDAFTTSNKREGFASFNHNFHVRQPEDFKLFSEMNKILSSHNINVPNYGGNIRGQGADVGYSKDKGITGNYETLSMRKAYEKYFGLRSAILFKGNDWGGGVVCNAINAGTPLITTKRYVEITHAQNVLKDGYNCFVITTPQEAAEAVLKLNSDDALVKTMSANMLSVRDSLFTDAYWEQFRNCVERSINA
jgi:glycosyltransferase involved in cell wall biosynthesis